MTGIALVGAAGVLLAQSGPAPERGPMGDPVELGVELHAPIVAARAVPNLAELPEASTFGTVPAAPQDATPDEDPDGQLVHPIRPVPVFDQPGGAAIGALPTTQLGSDTWVPVIADEPGWVHVLLPSRPNGSTGWLSTQDIALDTASTTYRIVIDRAAFRLTLYRDHQQIGVWSVGVGTAAAPTPAGRTFVLASIADPKQTFSPVILPLGIHSTTFTTYGGGPGTTGIHGWPTSDVFGRPSSDGCIRVPADALATLTGATDPVPIGTPVLIR
ncbi:L,D-transpeptidase family protein [Amycolatopsis nalaikhensis]|uniref:L,D-transpeptidase n=1 Tax=Amycolatopsis nalaikhensis TaxID=715472 RepID=A0ABY8XBZ5_9PSEU|nr:L,D-transpeptidase [Amycolatopsis sp. 2-2]WIV52834.1 L,D-transpeptidase [Amycolatopsis sp. 2-2]